MITAAVLGAGFLFMVTRLWGLAQNGPATGRDAMRVFGYSITYLTVLVRGHGGRRTHLESHSLGSPSHDGSHRRPSDSHPAGSVPPASGPGAAPPRKPRKIFLLVGLVLAAALGVGLFTRSAPSRSRATARGRPGAVLLRAPASTGRARSGCRPTAGAGARRRCCSSSGTGAPMPPGAAAAGGGGASTGARGRRAGEGARHRRRQRRQRNVGEGFVKAAGVTFPVAYDPEIAITSEDFYFQGDPYAVFVKGDGTITDIVRGPLSPATFTADEQSSFPAEGEGGGERRRHGPDGQHDPRLRRHGGPRAQAWRAARPRAPRPAAAWRTSARPLGQLRDAGRSCRRAAGGSGRGRWPRPGSPRPSACRP